MDKALKLIIRYILYTLIGSVAGTLFYLMYFHLLQYVPDGIPQKITGNDILKSYFKMLSYSVFIVPVVIMNHKLKRKGGFLQCLFYILLCVLSWSLLLPFSHKMYHKFQDKSEAVANYNPLSKNQFRQYNNKVYFFASDYNPDSDSDADISAVVIDMGESGSVTIEKIPEMEDFELITAAHPYRDLLVKNSFANNDKGLFINFNDYMARLDTAVEKGFSFILGFFTLGFVLCSIYGLANLSSWRLINSTMVIFMTVIVMELNSIYFLPEGSYIRNSSFAKNGLNIYLSNFVDDPLLCIINLVLGFIFILIGVIRFIVTSKADKSARKGA